MTTTNTNAATVAANTNAANPGKVLYFEGAGCVPRGEVENCRIRTAFHLDDGRGVYLEITGAEITKHNRTAYPGFVNVAVIDYCHYLDEYDNGADGCNNARVFNRSQRPRVFEYTKAEILRFVNSLGCSFDSVVILPDLAGYRVHDRDGFCNRGDEFAPNWENIARAEEIHRHFYAVEQAEGKKFPNFSLAVCRHDSGALHLLRHFEGYNKSWVIRCDCENWIDTMHEAPLGRCWH